MNDSLRHAWIYTAADLWEPLANYSAKNAAAPPDLFSDLFVAVDDHLSSSTPEQIFEELRNDPDKARENFLCFASLAIFLRL